MQMKHIVLKFVIIGLSLFVAGFLIDAIHFDDWGSLIIAALIFGLINAFVKPILVILTLPITLLTLGLFYLIIHILLFQATAFLVPGFTVETWLGAALGALITWLISLILEGILMKD